MKIITPATRHPSKRPVRFPAFNFSMTALWERVHRPDPFLPQNPNHISPLLDGAFRRNPLLLDELNFIHEREVLRLREHFLQMLSVGGFAE
jgi:hypothetical protein